MRDNEKLRNNIVKVIMYPIAMYGLKVIVKDMMIKKLGL